MSLQRQWRQSAKVVFAHGRNGSFLRNALQSSQASMRQVERLAELEHVDLLKHIEYKMCYNKLRQHKHGKAF